MKYFDEDGTTIYNGDCLEVLKGIQNDSVDCVITSPPYYQLRFYSGIPDYVWGSDKSCEHEFDLTKTKLMHENRNNRSGTQVEVIGNPTGTTFINRESKIRQGFCIKCGAWKGQLGLEPTYQLYLDHMIEIMVELKRVIKPSGSIWINLGDSYSTLSGGIRGLTRCDKQYGQISHKAVMGQGFDQTKQEDYPKKSLMLIPHRFAIRCIDELGLILRNDCVWAKRNGMPESVTDRFSKKHEFVFFFVKEQKYYFDLDGVRDKCTDQNRLTRRLLDPNNNNRMYKRGEDGSKAFGINPLTAEKARLNMLGKGKNPGDVSDFWDVPTQPSSAKHYATFNSELIDKPILAGCPEGGVILDPFCGTGTT
ncbi:MAG: site-specific DNA-methyltransferase, partial [Nitrospirota bacterium]